MTTQRAAVGPPIRTTGRAAARQGCGKGLGLGGSAPGLLCAPPAGGCPQPCSSALAGSELGAARRSCRATSSCALAVLGRPAQGRWRAPAARPGRAWRGIATLRAPPQLPDAARDGGGSGSAPQRACRGTAGLQRQAGRPGVLPSCGTALRPAASPAATSGRRSPTGLACMAHPPPSSPYTHLHRPRAPATRTWARLPPRHRLPQPPSRPLHQRKPRPSCLTGLLNRCAAVLISHGSPAALGCACQLVAPPDLGGRGLVGRGGPFYSLHYRPRALQPAAYNALRPSSHHGGQPFWPSL
jgi:hypothetical protein